MATGSIANWDGVSVKQHPYNAVGDGVTDDTTAIQAAINAVNAAGGGVVIIPCGTFLISSLTLKTGVILRGFGGVLVPGDSTSSKLKASATGIMIDTPNGSSVTGASVYGLYLSGLGSATALKGIRFRTATHCFIKNCTFDNFADEAIKVDSTSIACEFESILAQNSVLNRTRAGFTGVIDIDGTDHFIGRIESTDSGSIQGTVSSGSLYCDAIAIRGSNHFISESIGEISDIGWYIACSNSRFVSCRGDLNYGHGYYLDAAGSNQFTNCIGLSNSQDTTNTYDNWHALSTSANNLVSNFVSDNQQSKKTQYGIYDAVSSASNKNKYVNCESFNSVTLNFNSNSSNGSSFLFSNNGPITLTQNSTTPSVEGAVNFSTNNSSGTVITDFTGNVTGQIISIFCGDSNTTIQHNGSTISLFGSANKKLISGANYYFIKQGAVWREFCQFPIGVTADVGDAAKTIQARIDSETQIYASPITVDRAVTISTTGAYSGAKFRITRAASATGAFNVNVGTGPLKALGIGTWCDVEYNGSAWVLTAYGTL